MKSGETLNDKRIVESWHRNASPWTAAVRKKQIESRNLVTNAAIVDAVLSRKPSSVLDIGCGEGWLVRELAAHGVRGVGVDVVPALIDQARTAGGGDFQVASYEAIARGELNVMADVAVANFSLIGKESVEGIVSCAKNLLTDSGAFVVQTLHPVVSAGNLPYEDGWREGSWDGFSDEFSDPAPWYFRTMKSWLDLFEASGLRLVDQREPVHPTTAKPASVIFIAEVI